jgi:hypothetical protein
MFLALKMEVIYFSEISVNFRAIMRGYIPEARNLNLFEIFNQYFCIYNKYQNYFQCKFVKYL